MQNKIKVDLIILPIPIRVWDLALGDSFCLTESGKNLAGTYEVYRKLSSIKCVLASHPDKPVFTIPKLIPNDVGYKVIENWGLIEIEDFNRQDNG